MISVWKYMNVKDIHHTRIVAKHRFKLFEYFEVQGEIDKL